MNAFEWVDARDVEHAARLIGETTKDKRVAAKAGGLDLLDLMKEGVIAPSRLVNLKTIKGLDRIEPLAGGGGGRRDAGVSAGASIGALVTLDAIDHDPMLRKSYVALADAAGHAATPQVRHAATIGGNLLQKPRCWYLRHAYFHEADGPSIAERAIDGRNEFHAIFDNAKVPFVHASTPATALVAYDASVELVKADGTTRQVKLADFLLPPDADRPHDAAIADDEILTRVILPAPTNVRAAYHKQTERESYDWPLCDCAVVLTVDGDVVKDARIVAGWVAPTPRRMAEAEKLFIGKPLTEALARDAAAAAMASATPLSRNAYKVPILRTVIRRTLMAAIA